MAQQTQADFFYRLTPDEIIDALVKLGFEPSGHVAQLNSMENRVFDLRLEDKSHVVAKFYRPGRWTREQILEEHGFLFTAAENDIPVLAPLKPGGESLFEEQGIYFALWPRKGGREPEELTEIDLQVLGRLLARLHNVGEHLALRHRPRFSAQRFVHEPLRVLKEKNFLPEKLRVAYEACAKVIADIFDAAEGTLPSIAIHGDLHKGNMLLGSEGWFLLDFDDALVGPAVQDIWMLFPGQRDRADRERGIFLDAYREFRHFEDQWFDFAEALRAMRIIHYSGWIARRYDDPAFKAGFPTFADDAWWEEEIRVLREICAGYGDKPQFEHGTELANKDFFFDWED